jgi:hypothetical protein
VSEPKAAEGIGYRRGDKSCPPRIANAARDTFSDGLKIAIAARTNERVRKPALLHACSENHQNPQMAQ